jgi:hypothetical protein
VVPTTVSTQGTSRTCEYAWQFDSEIRALTLLDSPLTATRPSNQAWGIDQSIRYGTSTTILTWTAGTVDTGTVLTYIATGK